MLEPQPDLSLIKKYNQPVPRYTSYPTVPYWYEKIDKQEWSSVLRSRFDQHNEPEGISLYIHLPFCESLCTYCGCNKKITTNHSVEAEYLAVIEKEWDLNRRLMSGKPLIREIHLGGGTPTFFSPENLQRLIRYIKRDADIHPQHEFSIEGHPNNTTIAHLEMLYSEGFRRISYGVQDLDPEVQRVINRIQPFEVLQAATENARRIGFTSVNFDLIYGLPLQSFTSISNTIQQVLTLQPDRIAFYSYAHVPWTSKAQRLFDESHLPDPETKLGLYLLGKKMLLENGYADIGMDHFALPGDDLYKAWQSGTLHRNFMGYTTQHTSLLLGLGVSSISDTGNAFAQNAKTLHDYYRQIESGEPAVQKGYFLNEEDISFRNYILDISCKGYTELRDVDLPLLEEYVFPKLADMQHDGLVERKDMTVRLTDRGHYFIRNVCSAFDLYLGRETETKNIFSKAI
jgi:oxygen-independent coproporphyrinogen-3 oxidase